MTGLEGAAAGTAFKVAMAAGKRFAATSEFDLLCERLADRFSHLGWNDAEFKAWAGDDAVIAALGTYLEPTREPNRNALVAAVSALVGAVDAETPAEAFAAEIADAIPEEIRFAKRGDSLIRSEFDNLKREISAAPTGNDIRTIGEAFDRLDLVGSYLTNRDDYFSYVSIAGDVTRIEVPDSIMTIERTSPRGKSRVDVVPLNKEALERYGPQFIVRATNNPHGHLAANRLQDALNRGTGVDIHEGLTIEFSRMPPAFSELVGRAVAGRVRLEATANTAPETPARVWPVRLKAKTSRGTAVVNVDLHPADAAPPGWDLQLIGHHGGMTVTTLLRRESEHGQVSWNVTYAHDSSPLRDQVESLRFIDAFSGAGQLVVATRGERRVPNLCFDKTADGDPQETENSLAFIEAVLTLQDWAGVEYDIDREISAQEVGAVIQIANTIRNHGQPIVWHNWTANMPVAELQRLREGRIIRVVHTVMTEVLGREVVLGKSAVEMNRYVVASAKPAADSSRVDVLVEPPDDQSARVFQHLFRDTVPDVLPSQAKPPPPSPKRHRKTSKRHRRSKRRGR